MLAGKHIILGISGGIAAYQAVDLVGMLRAQLADVRVIMTRNATQFITPLTLATVSRNPVSIEMFTGAANPVIEHIQLGRMADLAVVAPATANFIGKIANGIADDLLTTLIMAVKKPVVICPAMNENMWLNPIVQENVKKLIQSGYHFVDPEYGAMACGGEGWGRLARLDKIVAFLIKLCRQMESENQSGFVSTHDSFGNDQKEGLHDNSKS